jgi:DNA-binding beta-propeller fold protein YncE
MIYGAHNGPTLSHSVIVPAPNGKLYAPPPNNGQILVIDPVSNSFNLLTERTYSGGYAAAALADNGKIYAPPYGAQQVLVIDTSTDTATLLMDQTFLSNRWLYRTAILAPNGKIYAMPFLATQVLVIDPSSDTSELLVGSFSGNIWWDGGGSGLYRAASLAGNGVIYAVPYDAEYVLLVDTTKNTAVQLVDGRGGGQAIGTVDDARAQYHTSVLANNGKIYAPPSHATHVLVVDPTTSSSTLLSEEYSGDSKYVSAALAPNGKIYSSPDRGRCSNGCLKRMPVVRWA